MTEGQLMSDPPVPGIEFRGVLLAVDDYTQTDSLRYERPDVAYLNL